MNAHILFQFLSPDQSFGITILLVGIIQLLKYCATIITMLNFNSNPAIYSLSSSIVWSLSFLVSFLMIILHTLDLIKQKQEWAQALTLQMSPELKKSGITEIWALLSSENSNNWKSEEMVLMAVRFEPRTLGVAGRDSNS